MIDVTHITAMVRRLESVTKANTITPELRVARVNDARKLIGDLRLALKQADKEMIAYGR